MPLSRPGFPNPQGLPLCAVASLWGEWGLRAGRCWRAFCIAHGLKRFLTGLIASSVLASAQAYAPEPPVESHPVGPIVFTALFVGFFVVFAWMVWRNKDKHGKGHKNPKP